MPDQIIGIVSDIAKVACGLWLLINCLDAGIRKAVNEAVNEAVKEDARDA